MWPDRETTDDLIGFRVHADLIRAVVTDPTMLPTTIGVFGDWGGGKTSIMKMLEASLDPESYPEGSVERTAFESIAVVYVNTWQFEGYDDAKSAIISSILLELAVHKTFGTKVKEKAVSLLKRVNWMRFAKLTLSHVAVPAAAAFFSGGVAAIPAAVAIASGFSKRAGGDASVGDEDCESPELGQLLKADSDSGTMDIKDFRDQFEEMLKAAGITTLLVLVDDLDRCTPERIIENLEAVKLFLSAEQTAFVIGADRRIVEHAIREKYAQQSTDAGTAQGDKLVRDYLEKLVQIPYTLPRLSATEIHTYMTLLFCSHHLSAHDYKVCVSACEVARSVNRYGTFGYGEVRKALNNATLTEPLAEALTLSASASPLIADGLEGNPRQVKRFLNALLLRKKLATVAGLENIKDAVLVKLMILEYANVDLFTTLFNSQARHKGFPSEIKELEDAVKDKKKDNALDESAAKLGGKWGSVEAKRWIQMEPMLQDVDLRDYFWVARDRLESTFAGIAMMPPAIKAVLDGLLSGVAPKRNASVQSARALGADERQLLVQALDEHITRQPDIAIGYDALAALIEADVEEAASTLADILAARPLTKVPPSVGMSFGRLVSAKPQFKKEFGVAVDALQKDPKSGAGKGFAESSAGKK